MMAFEILGLALWLSPVVVYYLILPAARLLGVRTK
jgi:hypothetical protein